MKPPLLRSAFAYVFISLLIFGSSWADVLVSELMVHPLHVDGREPTSQEFVELWNRGSVAVELGGWQFDRGIQFTFPSYVLPAGSFVVVASDPMDAAFAGITPLLGPWTGRLSNSGERLRLIDASGDTIDEVRYADEGDWASRRHINLAGQLSWEWIAPFDGDGYSLELVDADWTNDSGQNWKSSVLLGGTPGQRNSQEASSTAPLIDDVRHHPAVPTARERVVVRAGIVTRGRQRANATLFYRVSKLEPDSFISLPMTLEATGSHAATIPPHSDQSVIEFYVETRLGEATRRWPDSSDAQGAQDANALFQVDDEFEESDQPYYRIIMTVAEDARFRPGVFPSRSDAQMNATFVNSRRGETSIRYQAGLRYRGNSSRSRNPRSFRLALPSDAPWRSMTTLNLVGQYTYLQAFGLHLFKAAELPAPEAILVQLRLNGINYANGNNRFNVHFGSYAHIQPLSGEFIEQALPDDSQGDLYKKVSANPRRDQKRWGVHFEEEAVYKNPNWYITDRWTKETNGSANDWSRFQDFIVTINEAAPETYIEEVSSRVNIEQWVRWFALMNLINNRETNLSNGIDDDYSIYQGLTDPRIILLPHDLDTIFGRGDSSSSANATIFQMIDRSFGSGDARMPQLEAFFHHPQIGPLYYQTLDDLIETVLKPERFEPLLDSLLAHVPTDERNRIKTFNQARRTHVRSIIDAPIAVTPPELPFDGVAYDAITDSVDLSGSVSPMRVDGVLINGIVADYDRGVGQWSVKGLSLNSGINRLRIEALSETAKVVSQTTISIRTPSQGLSDLSGLLDSDTTLASTNGPYQVTEDLVVPEGVTLTISEGTSMNFREGVQLQVVGTLVIVGTESKPVTLNGESWAGLALQGPSTGHQISHTVILGVQTENPAIALTDTFLTADHVDLSGHFGLALSLNGASMHLNESLLSHPSITSTGGILPGFPLTLEGNALGQVIITERSISDQSTITIDDNTFMDTDLGLRIEGRARLRGNTFDGVGTAIELQGGELLIANQRFLGVVKVLDQSGGCQITLEHSVIHQVDQLIAGEAADTRAFIANNVITQLASAIPNTVSAPSFLQFTHNFLAPDIASTLLTGNVRGGVIIPGTDPHYEADFTLSPSSPGIGSATHGEDLGLVERSKPAVLGPPLAQTSSRNEFVGFYGSGWEQVEYRLDNGDWLSLPLPWLPEPGEFREAFLPLQNLADGLHRLDFREDANGPEGAFTWTVGQAGASVILNEISAINKTLEFDGTFPDWVELYNPGASAIALAGFQLGGDGDQRLAIPEETELGGGRYLVVPLATTNGDGFALNRQGETLTLYDPQDGIVDRISFGRQLPSYTLGRLPADPNTWGLVIATPNDQNQRALTGAASNARFNEWYVASGLAYDEDFIELTNADSTLPINVSEIAIVSSSQTHQLPEYSFLGPNDFYTLKATDLGFGLNPWFGHARLQSNVSGDLIDEIFWQGEHAETSTGRTPDASGPWAALSQASPGQTNEQAAPPPVEGLRISEIHYHPAAGQSEWLELLNIGSEPLNLEGLHFSTGIDFTFGATSIAPQERVILVSDETAFRAQYGQSPRVIGTFVGRLDNAGERFAIRRVGSGTPKLLATAYQPEWYPLANGIGFTLITRDESRRMSEDREDWQSGMLIGGTPGAAESPLIYSSIQTGSIVGDFLFYQIEALNSPTIYSATNLPAGLDFDPATGIVSGSTREFGSFPITIGATNATGNNLQTWVLEVAPSGPFTNLQWESVPNPATQGEPFEATLTARDDAGRLVRDVQGEFSLDATVSRGGGPPVLINEIRDSGTDGLTVTKLDPSIDTTGWRLFLNSAADRDINAVHGINSNGSIVDLPADFTKLDLPESRLGFNLQWTDDSPSERQGARRGWALIADDLGKAVDFVVWGYSAEDFSRWTPKDEFDQPITGPLWTGPTVVHPGSLGFTLARQRAVDSDSARDWQWLPRNQPPPLAGPSRREAIFDVGLLSSERLPDHTWRLTAQSSAFGSDVSLTVTEKHSGYQVASAPFQVLPSGPPQLPPTLTLEIVAGQPVALPSLEDPLTESLEIEEGAQLILDGSRILAQIDEPGSYQVSITGRNAVGESATVVDFTVLPDADSDGLPDTWETTFAQTDPAADPDNDGVSNLTEFLADTVPTDIASAPFLAAIQHLDRAVELRWASTPGSIYTVESGQGLRGTFVWKPVHEGWILSESAETSFTFTPDARLIPEGRLLRVRVWENGMK